NGSEKSAFLFQTVFKNGTESSVKTLGVTSAIFKNLKNDNYFLRIAAFDLQRKWMAIPVELEIEIDNDKYNLVRENDSLSNRMNALIHLVKNPAASDSLSGSKSSGFPTVTNYILLGFVIILLVIIVIL